MPELTRPDGVELHWDQRGERGPLIVCAFGAFSFPNVYDDLCAELARDTRVVTYDMRGTGGSTRQGPYDMGTDVTDAQALIEALGGDAVLVGVANGGNVGVHIAFERPDLVRTVVTMGGVPVEREALAGTEGFIGSQSVVEMMFEQAQRDWRGALRAFIASVNPQLDEAGARERVEAMAAYAPAEAVLARTRVWDEDRPKERCRALGDRVWMLRPPDDPWISPDGLGRLRELLPEAHVEELEEGPLSRPDLTAEAIRRIVGAAP